MCKTSLGTTPFKVRLPAGYVPKQVEPTEPESFTPAESAYDLYYDIRIVIASINAGLVDHTDTLKLRMWLLGLPVVNQLRSHMVDFPKEAMLPLYNYVEAKHPYKANWVFRAALYYLSCQCTFEVRQGVLQWISDNSKT
jgi:hypothetical protein